MTAQTRVEELKKRYHENPRRFFAPLANEYRKSGFVDRAILLCEKHLGEQPGNMNGLVVYGQCLVETGRHAEAQGPFEAALALDPENLIALRNLGDIARLTGDADAARKWYGKVLELDRRNDEVIALLGEVGGRVEQPSARLSAQQVISVAGSVSMAGAAEPQAAVELPVAPAHRPPTPPAPLAATAPPPRTRTPVDPTAKTVEVSAQAAPPNQASILDVSFDFGENSGPPTAIEFATGPTSPPRAPTPVAPMAAAPERPIPTPAVLGAPVPPVVVEAAPPSRVAPPLAEAAPASPVAPAAAEKHLDDLLDDLPESMPLELVKTTPITLPVGLPPRAPVPTPPISLAPLVDGHEDSNLGELPRLDGIFALQFDAKVAPLDDLEPTEFAGGGPSTPVTGLETGEFEAPSEPLPGIDGLESEEFTPLAFPLASAAPDAGDIAAPADHALGAVLEEGAPPMRSAPAPEPAAREPDAAPVAETPLPELPADPDDFAMVEPPPAARPDARASVAGLPLLEPLGEEPAPHATVPEFEARARRETPAAFVTETMAQVYVQQGHVDKAKDVYRQLIAQSPEDAGLRARLAALDVQASAPVAEAATAADAPRPSLGFDGHVDAPEEPVPANAMLSAMSFEGLALETPRVGTSSPVPTPAPSGPNAREYFARFAYRALTPAVPVTPVFTAAVGEAPAANGRLLSPLDALFGPSVRAEDEAAAHRVAAIGATSGPSGGTALDSLFGEGPSAPMPPDTAPGARPAVTRASQKLNFDQFFASSVADAAPSGPVPSPEATAGAEDAGEPGDDDDLDQFHGWLRGLTS